MPFPTRLLQSIANARRFKAYIAVCSLAVGNVHAEDVRFRDLIIPNQSGKAMTVTGAVDPATLGATLMHEHLIFKWPITDPDKYPLTHLEKWKEAGWPFTDTAEARRYWNAPFTAQDRHSGVMNKDLLTLDNVDDAVNEVRMYRALGGGTIVDVTPISLGRDPKKLAEISREAGIEIVMGTGFYRKPFFPDGMSQRSIDDLTYQIVADLVKGADGTTIRSGIIGEVGAEDLTLLPMESDEVRSLRAAARASRLTGAAITLHDQYLRPVVWHTGLNILEEEGADLSRVVMGHVTGVEAKDIGFLESLLKRGVYLEFDALGRDLEPDKEIYDQRLVLGAIVTLLERGYAHRILVSQDVCAKAFLIKYGGWGFTFVHKVLLPYLRDQGVNEKDLNTLLKDNPRRLLTFVKPRSLKSALPPAGDQ